MSLFLFISFAIAEPLTVNVESLRAKPDGKTDGTKAFLAAWAKACASINPAVIYVPAGSFLLSKVVFTGQCKSNAITFEIAGTLVAPSDYRVIGNADNWILFQHVNGVTISGGILDGQGTGLWACKSAGKTCPTGATVSSSFYNVLSIVYLIVACGSCLY